MSDSDRVDAERWRALMKSARITFLGSSGEGARMHWAIEVWGTYPIGKRNPKQTEDARKILTKYADDRRKEGYR